jgi:RNA polymerase sigma factor (sigma-70 family)
MLNRNGANSEDIVQEVMIIVRRCWGRYPRPDLLIFLIARQELGRAARRAQHQNVPLHDHLTEADATIQRQAETDPMQVVDERDRLIKLLQKLSNRQQETVVLIDAVGLSVGQTGEVLGISESAVKTHHRRGLARLAELEANSLASTRHPGESQKEGSAQ